MNRLLEALLVDVCEKDGVPVADVVGKSRKRKLVRVRCKFAALAVADRGATYAEIGEILGGRGHCAVVHYLKRVGLTGKKLREKRAGEGLFGFVG